MKPPKLYSHVVTICGDCLDVKGKRCHNPECVFCRQPMSVVRKVLALLGLSEGEHQGGSRGE